MRNAIKIKQHDITDCGAACLSSILAFYGLKFPISRIRQFASTDKNGTNVLGMIEAAEKLGFTAKGVKGPYEVLYDIPKPAIAHVILKGKLHHYIVIYSISKNKITIMDPSSGMITKRTHDDFKNEWTGILIILSPTDRFDGINYKSSILSRFLNLIIPQKSILIQALFGAIIYSLLGLSTSIFVQKIFDYVLIDGNLNLLHLMGIIMFILLLVKIFIGTFKSLLVVRAGQRIDAVLILNYYKHLLKLPQQFFDTMRIGEILSRFNDAIKIRLFISNVAIDLVVNTMILFFTLLIMFLFSWKLALIFTFAIPIFVILYAIFNKLNKKFLRVIMEDAANLEAHIVESLNSLATIKKFASEDYSNLKLEFRFINMLHDTWKSAQSSIISLNLTEFISASLTIILLWLGSVKVISQEITPGILMSFYALASYMLSPIGSLISSNQSIQDAVIAADRLFQILDLEQEQEDQNTIILTREMVSDIKFKNVTFRYGSRKELFNNLNFVIKKGKFTAIIGESGCGKTTLVSLLQNIYPIQSGLIEIGNYDLKHISNNSLRKIISIVPQHIDLFDGSIIENVALGETEPDIKRIIDICTALEINRFIETMPNSYLTLLGEHGVSLSGGEKQRLALARALYKNPEIIILDEATSALDSYSESIVKNVLRKIRETGKTIIIITHRFSTIADADTIFLIEKGQMVECGTHNDLLKQKGRYFLYYNKQKLG